MWHLAKKIMLTAGQTDIKVEFPLPIVACNIMIEYSDFYENVQVNIQRFIRSSVRYLMINFGLRFYGFVLRLMECYAIEEEEKLNHAPYSGLFLALRSGSAFNNKVLFGKNSAAINRNKNLTIILKI